MDQSTLDYFVFYWDRLQEANLFVAGMAACLATVSVSLVIRAINNRLDQVTALIFGLILLSTATAIVVSGGKTMLIANIPLILMVLYRKMQFQLPMNPPRIDYRILFVGLYVVFFFFSFVSSIDWLGGSLRFSHYDSTFYGRLVDYLDQTGRENYYMDSIYSESRPLKLYHYTEHWFAVLVKRIAGGGAGLVLFEFVVNPILYALCTVALLGLVQDGKRSNYWAGAIVILSLYGFVATELNKVLPSWLMVDVLRGWAPLTYPKITIAVVCITLLFRAIKTKKPDTVIFYSAFLAVNYITFLPALAIFNLSFLAYQALTNWFAQQVTWRLGVVTITMVGSLIVWYCIGPVGLCEIPATPIELIMKTILNHGLNVAVLDSWYLFMSFLPAFALIFFIGVGIGSADDTTLTVGLVGSSVLAASLMCFNDQSFQAFQNVSIPVINVFIMWAIVRSESKLSKYVRGALLAFLSLVFVSRTMNKVSYIRLETLNRADRFIEGCENVRTVFLRSPQSLESLHGKYPSLNPPGQWIFGMDERYSPISINELSWEPKETLHRSKEFDYRCNSPFYFFAEGEKGVGKSTNDIQKQFIREYGIRLVEAEEGVDIGPLVHQQPSDSLILQNGTRIYKF